MLPFRRRWKTRAFCFGSSLRWELVLLISALAASAGLAAERPNIVLIVADDLGWSDLACYGSDFHETPRIDGLASEGVRFTQAYAASPVCSPTRASILTGRHPARLKMTIWREAARTRGRRKLLEPLVLDSLPLSERTLAEILHDHGYYTAHIGKWHLGRAEAYPQPHGFDVNIGGTLWGAPQTFFYPFRGDQYFRDWRYVPDLEPSQPGDYLTDRLTDRAIEVMKRVRSRPFFINLWYHAVHTPIEGKRRLVDKYEKKLAGRKRGRYSNPDYAAMVETLDTNVGRILDALEELELADRTIVVFFSDNGGYVNICRLQPGRPVTSNAPLRSGKGSLYEGGIRVPLIVRLPEQQKRGGVCDVPVTSCDLLPTLLSLVGLSEETEKLELDGIDLSQLVRSPDDASPSRPLFFHYPHYYPTTTPVSAVRDGRWKLLEYFETNKTELYDLAEDVGEKRNVAERFPEKVAKLKRMLDRWRDSVGAPLPEPNPDYRKEVSR